MPAPSSLGLHPVYLFPLLTVLCLLLLQKIVAMSVPIYWVLSFLANHRHWRWSWGPDTHTHPNSQQSKKGSVYCQMSLGRQNQPPPVLRTTSLARLGPNRPSITGWSELQWTELNNFQNIFGWKKSKRLKNNFQKSHNWFKFKFSFPYLSASITLKSTFVVTHYSSYVVA